MTVHPGAKSSRKSNATSSMATNKICMGQGQTNVTPTSHVRLGVGEV